MIKHYQTITEGTGGDCMQYAVASMCDLDPKDVPEFHKIDRPVKCMDAMIDFFHELGKGVVRIPVPEGEVLFSNFSNQVPQLYLSRFLFCNRRAVSDVLIAVKSFNHQGEHLVCGELKKGVISITHDPNPNNRLRCFNDYEITEIMIFVDYGLC